MGNETPVETQTDTNTQAEPNAQPEEQVEKLDFTDTWEKVVKLSQDDISNFTRDVLLTYGNVHNLNVVSIFDDTKLKMLEVIGRTQNALPLVTAAAKEGIFLLLAPHAEKPDTFVVLVESYGVWDKEEGFTENEDSVNTLRPAVLEKVVKLIEETYDESIELLTTMLATMQQPTDAPDEVPADTETK